MTTTADLHPKEDSLKTKLTKKKKTPKKKLQV
jgi:hypothetical protein